MNENSKDISSPNSFSTSSGKFQHSHTMSKSKSSSSSPSSLEDSSNTSLPKANISTNACKTNTKSNSHFQSQLKTFMSKFNNINDKTKRRKHKNSKLGCPNCKKRRVKCSEDLPSCQNCIKHKVKCGYLEYTTEQIEELKKQKNLQSSNQFINDDPEDILPQFNSTFISKQKIKPKLIKKSSNTSSPSLTPSPSSSSTNAHHKTLSNSIYYQSIKQNYDNISNEESKIIYPVYTFDRVPKEIKIEKFKHSQPLKNALKSNYTFNLINRQRDNSHDTFESFLKTKGRLIIEGKSNLQEIRLLYKYWLGSFFFKAHISQLMFNCLLNLSTNFLISNCFQDKLSLFKNEKNDGAFNYYSNAKKMCLIKSIDYYAKVIKDLRELLANNEDPDLTSSVSYILSLMAIYDPEATLQSMNCFRDGMFGILIHKCTTTANSKMLGSVHLKLMKNIIMSVYLPNYDPTFIGELFEIYKKFGELLHSNLEKSDKSTRLINFKYDQLLRFINQVIQEYLPLIIGNSSDLHLQQKILFQINYHWVRFYPAKINVENSFSNEIQPVSETILYLFYRGFKNALFNIFPQIRFFFLRDFDSPLMSDGNGSNTDYEFFADQLQRLNKHHESLSELKFISSYLIRMITFFQIRINILYKYLVYNNIDDQNLKIDDDVFQWRSSITDLDSERQKFKQIFNFKETQIISFMNQHIKSKNYPSFNSDVLESINDENPIVNGLDFMSLQENGLLMDDYDARNDNLYYIEFT